MQHKYTRNYDYSDKFAPVRVSMEQKMRLKEYAESLCNDRNGFVSMKDIIDSFLDGNMETFVNYTTWLERR